MDYCDGKTHYWSDDSYDSGSHPCPGPPQCLTGERKRLAEEEKLRAQNVALMAQDGEPTINVGGVPVPLSMAAAAVGRCIRAIQATDRLIAQGFASNEDLRELKATLTGENDDD